MTELIQTNLEAMGRDAKAASRRLAVLSTEQKNAALHAIADALEAQADAVLAQNALDLADAGGQQPAACRH